MKVHDFIEDIKRDILSGIAIPGQVSFKGRFAPEFKIGWGHPHAPNAKLTRWVDFEDVDSLSSWLFDNSVTCKIMFMTRLYGWDHAEKYNSTLQAYSLELVRIDVGDTTNITPDMIELLVGLLSGDLDERKYPRPEPLPLEA